MSKKYEKTRMVKVASFKVGDTVSAIIPKRDRHAANQKRTPCVIIDKPSGLQPTYKLLSEHGVLNKRFNASKLMLYPGEIYTGNSEKKVSLWEVARKLNGQKIVCTCKSGCKNSNCKCQRNNVLCLPRCHKDITTCDNKTQKNNKTVLFCHDKRVLPRFGRPVCTNGNILYRFHNTCPVYNWLALLKVMENYFQNMKTEGLLKTILQYVRNCNYSEVKFDISVFKNLPIAGNGTIDFFGSEFEMIIEPPFGTFFSHFVTSECDSPFCINKCTIRKYSKMQQFASCYCRYK